MFGGKLPPHKSLLNSRVIYGDIMASVERVTRSL